MQAYQHGFHYPKYLIITYGGYFKHWWKVDTATNDCTAEQRGQALLYSLAAVPSQFPRQDDEYVAEPNIVSVCFSAVVIVIFQITSCS